MARHGYTGDGYGIRDEDNYGRDRDREGRWQRDRDRGGFWASDRDRGNWDRDDDRGFFERMGDEMSSWFGRDEREREDSSRRDTWRSSGQFDEDRGRGHGYGRGMAGESYGRHNEDRGYFRPDDYGSDFGSGEELRGRGGYAPGSGRRSTFGGSTSGGGFGSPGSGFGPSGRDEFGQSSAREDQRRMGRQGQSGRQGQWSQQGRQGGQDRDEPGVLLYEEYTFSVPTGNQDDHYRSWRDRQLQSLDRDYADYCREREQRFHQDFDQWRQGRGEGRQGGDEPRRIGGSSDETSSSASGKSSSSGRQQEKGERSAQLEESGSSRSNKQRNS